VAAAAVCLATVTGVKNSHAANRRARTESTASDAPSESSSVASHPVSKPPSQLPIAHPHQPASAPSGDKANTGAGPQQDGAGKQHERGQAVEMTSGLFFLFFSNGGKSVEVLIS